MKVGAGYGGAGGGWRWVFEVRVVDGGQRWGLEMGVGGEAWKWRMEMGARYGGWRWGLKCSFFSETLHCRVRLFYFDLDRNTQRYRLNGKVNIDSNANVKHNEIQLKYQAIHLFSYHSNSFNDDCMNQTQDVPKYELIHILTIIDI